MLYFLPLLIYFPQFLPGIETQPFAIFAYSLFLLFYKRKKLPIITTVLLFLFTTIIIFIQNIISTVPKVEFDLFYLLIGPIIFIGTISADLPPPKKSSLKIITLIFLLIAIIEITTPSLYESIASHLLTRFNITDGHRGISLLTPEPTYASISLIYLIFLTFWSRSINNRRGYLLEFIQITLLAATLSTYVIVFFAIAFLLLFPKLSIILTGALIILIPFAGDISLSNEESIRSVVAISRLLSIDLSHPLIELSQLDASLGSRVISNTSAILTISHSIFGLGLSCDSLPNSFTILNYDFAYSNEVISNVIENGCLKPQAYIPSLFMAMGLSSFIFISIFISLLLFNRDNMKIWPSALIFSFTIFLIQGQLSNPIPWMILYFAVKPSSKNKNI